MSLGAKTKTAVAFASGYLGTAAALLMQYLDGLESLSDIDPLAILRGALYALFGGGMTGAAYRTPAPTQEVPTVAPEPSPTTPAPDAPPSAAAPDAPAREFRFGTQSEMVLAKADPLLAAVHRRALELTDIDFACYESERTVERQRQNIREGVSWTMDSRHLERPARAIDHVPIVDGHECWEWYAFERTTAAIKVAAREMDVPCVHGIDWAGKKKDGPHTELSREHFPFELPPDPAATPA